ncbi:MAG TPA: hypothetical protein ENN77_02355, partial [Candidatus Wirthbacteria bacterium]|nr:hypothetical protein [Candidatus Wirthbacteria bacterium]
MSTAKKSSPTLSKDNNSNDTKPQPGKNQSIAGAPGQPYKASVTATLLIFVFFALLIILPIFVQPKLNLKNNLRTISPTSTEYQGIDEYAPK